VIYKAELVQRLQDADGGGAAAPPSDNYDTLSKAELNALLVGRGQPELSKSTKKPTLVRLLRQLDVEVDVEVDVDLTSDAEAEAVRAATNTLASQASRGLGMTPI
jgi:hypothetical protein